MGSDSGAETDLDALIGEIRREAARRRAAPDFPIDEEARLGTEMDGQGPRGPGADLVAVSAALRNLQSHAEGPLAELAGLAASAVRALTLRLEILERHGSDPVTRPAVGGPLPDLHPWLGLVIETAPAAGRILVAGPGADEWVGALAGAGKDAYGVDPALQSFADQGPTRSGPVLEHLRTVGDQALAGAVLVGAIGSDDAQGLGPLARELARTADRVDVVSESPWAWRQRVGEAAADTSSARPVGPEAWLAALDGAGFACTGRYGARGRDFLLSAEKHQ